MIRNVVASAAILFGLGMGAAQAGATMVPAGFIYDVERQGLECVECGDGNAFYSGGDGVFFNITGTITTTRLGTITSNADIVGFDLVATSEGLPGPQVEFLLSGEGSDVRFFNGGELLAEETSLTFQGPSQGEVVFEDNATADSYSVFVGSISESLFAGDNDFFAQAEAFDQNAQTALLGTRRTGPPPTGDVPVPFAAPLLLTGLGALVVASRRRKAA